MRYHQRAVGQRAGVAHTMTEGQPILERRPAIFRSQGRTARATGRS